MQELPEETARRLRRELANIQSGHRNRPARFRSLPKIFNINTYKFHALGDYGKTIWMFGTADGYTTQVVGVRHYLRLTIDHTPQKMKIKRANGRISSLKISTVDQTRKLWRASLPNRRGEKPLSGGN